MAPYELTQSLAGDVADGHAEKRGACRRRP